MFSLPVAQISTDLCMRPRGVLRGTHYPIGHAQLKTWAKNKRENVSSQMNRLLRLPSERRGARGAAAKSPRRRTQIIVLTLSNTITVRTGGIQVQKKHQKLNYRASLRWDPFFIQLWKMTRDTAPSFKLPDDLRPLLRQMRRHLSHALKMTASKNERLTYKTMFLATQKFFYVSFDLVTNSRIIFWIKCFVLHQCENCWQLNCKFV